MLKRELFPKQCFLTVFVDAFLVVCADKGFSFFITNSSAPTEVSKLKTNNTI